MSSGPADAAAESKLSGDVWREAFDLVEQIGRLGRAIMRARMGHRGWNIPRRFIVSEVNNALTGTGFRFFDDSPNSAFEDYPGAFNRETDTKRLRIVALAAALEELYATAVELELKRVCGTRFYEALRAARETLDAR